MPIKSYYYFPDEVGIPSTFTEVEGGSGAVSLTSNHLRITNGGTTNGDYATAVYNTALDQTKLYVIMAECKMSGTVGAWVPNLLGLVDSSGAPGAMTASARDTALLMWQEYQMSGGADNFDRIQLKVRNPSNAEYNYVASTDTWQTLFANTRSNFDEDSYYRFVIVYDGTQATPRARSMVFGYTEDTNFHGWALNYDSSWRNFDTNATDIDPVNNDLWVVLGDPTNDETKSVTTFDFRRVMIGELVESNVEEFAFTNNGSGSFPIDYELFLYLNPMPDDCTMWIPRDVHDAGAVVSLAGDDWVKDAHCHFDGTTYWLFYQRRDGVSSDSEIFVSSTTDILDGTWASETLISSPDTGEAKHEFPWATKYSGTWYLIYGVEFTTTAWEIQYKTTTATNPTSGWSSAATLFDPSGSTTFDDDGATQPFPVWHSGTFTGGTWYMSYAGAKINGSTVWNGGLAKSTTGIVGTYTKVQAGAFFATEGASTLLAGAHTDDETPTVDSTTGFNAGEYIMIETPTSPYEILSVDSGTVMTVQLEVTADDNDVMQSFAYNSVAPRYGRYVNGYWHFYMTAFKFSGVENEAVHVYVDTAGEAALEDCTFRAARVGDTAIDMVIPPVACYDVACENIGATWEELTPIDAGTTVPIFTYHLTKHLQG